MTDLPSTPDVSADGALHRIVACVVLGNEADAMRKCVRWVLREMKRPDVVVEAVMHVCTYAGIPRTLDAIDEIRDLVGVIDGAVGASLDSGERRQQLGLAVLERLHPEAAPNLLRSLAPVAPLMQGVVTDAFAVHYSRDVVPMNQRQLWTIVALATLDHSPRFFKTHVEAAYNLGIAREDVTTAINDISPFIGNARRGWLIETVGDVYTNCKARQVQRMGVST